MKCKEEKKSWSVCRLRGFHVWIAVSPHKKVCPHCHASYDGRRNPPVEGGR